MYVPLLFALAVALSVIAIFVGILRLVEKEESPVARLQAYTGSPSSTEQRQTRARREPSPLAARLNRAIASRKFAETLATGLARANLRLTVPEYVLINIACVCVGFSLGIFISHRVIPALMLAAVGFALPGMYLKRRQEKRLAAFNNQLGDVLTLLVGSLRAGYSLLHAMDTVVGQVAPPASEEFGRVVREVNLGLPLEEALENLVRRVGSDDLELMVTAINIHHEVGGNLADVLETIEETIRQRVRLQGEIRILTTQQRVTGYILTFLPFILAGILFLINPTYMMRLFTPGWTLAIPIGALISVFLGFLIMRRIVAIEV